MVKYSAEVKIYVCLFFAGAVEMTCFTAIMLLSFSHASLLFYQIVFPLHAFRHAKDLKWVHLIVVIAGQPT